MFLSREIDIKLFQNYTKSYIYQISYKVRSIKQTIFNNYATNLKTTLSHRSLRISDLLLLYFLIFILQYIGITSPKLPPIAVQYTGHVIHVTRILLCYWRKFWWRNTRLYKLSIVFGIIFDTVLYQFLETGTSDRRLIGIV